MNQETEPKAPLTKQIDCLCGAGRMLLDGPLKYLGPDFAYGTLRCTSCEKTARIEARPVKKDKA